MLYWLALIIPFVIAIYYKVKFNREITWLEFLGSLVIAILIIGGSILIYSFSIGQDRKLVSGWVVGKEWVPEHETTVCYPVSCGKDCTTIQCHQVTIPDDWKVYVESNKPKTFIKKEGSYGGEVWGAQGRAIGVSESYYKSVPLGEPAVWEEYFDNPLKKTKSSLYTKQKDNKYPYLHMPEIYSYYKIKRIDNLTRIAIPDLNMKLNDINSGLNGWDINLGLIITVLSEDFVEYQENYWLGGNPNDFIIFIGVNSEGKIVWSKSVAWGNELLKVEIRDLVLNSKDIQNLDTILDGIRGKIVKYGFQVADFGKFNYLKVNLPMYMVVLIHILTLIGTIVVLECFKENDIYY